LAKVQLHTAIIDTPNSNKKDVTMRKMLSIITAAALLAPAFIVPTAPAQARSEDREWRGKDGRLYCRKSNGTVGLVVGAAGGALLGRAVDTRGERTTGTILGAAGGALLGRELQRKRRCR
jgi:Glycine zipper 2TM domain